MAATPEQMKTMREKAAQLRASGELKVLNPLERALKNPGSRTLAINAKCYDCTGAGCDPNWKKAIRDCGVTKCALFAFRPYQKGSADE